MWLWKREGRGRGFLTLADELIVGMRGLRVEMMRVNIFIRLRLWGRRGWELELRFMRLMG